MQNFVSNNQKTLQDKNDGVILRAFIYARVMNALYKRWSATKMMETKQSTMSATLLYLTPEIINDHKPPKILASNKTHGVHGNS